MKEQDFNKLIESIKDVGEIKNGYRSKVSGRLFYLKLKRGIIEPAFLVYD